MKIVHADGHALLREGIHHILQQEFANLEFLEAHTVQAALDLMARWDDIDLVLLNTGLAERNDFSGFKRIWEGHPTVPIVVLSTCDDPDDVMAAIDMGAAGYIPTSVTGQTLLGALKLVLAGGIYAPRIGSRSRTRNQTGHGQASHSDLTKRQREVLELIAEGLSNKAIARKLFVSEATIKGHVTAILNILQVDNRIQAINKASRRGAGFRPVAGPVFDVPFAAG